MSKHEADVLAYIKEYGVQNQRLIAEETGLSLGTVNKSLKVLVDENYIDESGKLLEKAKIELEQSKPQKAIILAAGYGMRMVPINTECPKGLLVVKGEVLIERTIKQLKTAGIDDIYVVVGYMKEAYEYLIDEFGVKLIVNNDYKLKNNMHSLALAEKHICNTYIVPCDIYCVSNPFGKNELYSWYMVSDELDEDSPVRVSRKNEIVESEDGTLGNTMIGIAYICQKDAKSVCANLLKMDCDKHFANSFWEDVFLLSEINMIAKVVRAGEYVEINTYEQLREMDVESDNVKSDVIDVICKALNVTNKDVTDIEVLKKGMTNRSFLFSCNGKRYIMRVPGEGTSKLINRENEAYVYNTINKLNISDNIAFISPNNGYKITEYLEGARVCDPEDESDLVKCMDKLREFHNMSISVNHEFDIFGQIEFYEELWNGTESVFRDYKDTKRNVLSLRDYIEKYAGEKCLTHIDAVPDNFLFATFDGKEQIRLIDWEYAGMQDPHVDVAMFCIYSMYDRPQIDRLIDIYFENACPTTIRKKIYCYIAACGLLWSNWCEYKRQLGIEFGEYSLKQYRYAKEYYRIAQEMEIDE